MFPIAGVVDQIDNFKTKIKLFISLFCTEEYDCVLKLFIKLSSEIMQR